MQRNLMYHICALKKNEAWMRNLQRLARYAHMFDGCQMYVIACGEGIHEPSTVIHALHDLGLYVERLRTIANCPRLREVAGFRAMLPEMLLLPGRTFFAHTKGNSSVDSKVIGDLDGAVLWRNAMYTALLRDYEKLVAPVMVDGSPITGCCKLVWATGVKTEMKVRPLLQKSPFPTGLEPHFKWMFAGTFFWFDNAIVRAQSDWSRVADDRYGAEAWPAQMFPHYACKSAYDPLPDRMAYDPYSPRTYAQHPELEDIKQP